MVTEDSLTRRLHLLSCAQSPIPRLNGKLLLLTRCRKWTEIQVYFSRNIFKAFREKQMGNLHIGQF